MRAIQTFLSACLLLGAVASAQADGSAAEQQCSATQLGQLGDQLGVARFTRTENGVVVSAACKVWPYDTSKVIVAVAFATEEEDKKGFVVAVTDAVTGKVLNLHREYVEEDAVMELGSRSLKIDTARYDLAPGARAFAVDMESTGPGASCPEAGAGPQRSLYVQRGDQLQKVLGGLDMASWQFASGGKPMCLGARAGKVVTVVEVFPVSIGIADSSTNGFADLRITIRSELDHGGKSERKPFRYTLKFDGKHYPTEAMKKDYWAWRY